MWPLGIERWHLSCKGTARLLRVASLGLAVAVVGSAVTPASAESLATQHPINVAASKLNVPVIDASTPQRSPQAKPAVAVTGTRTINTPTPSALVNAAGSRTSLSNPVKIANTGVGRGAVGGIINLNPPPGAYNVPTLILTQVQPTPAVEGQPLQVSFNLTNNSSAYTLSGNVIESGNGSDLFGGVQSVNRLAPGATISGAVSDTAPLARTRLWNCAHAPGPLRRWHTCAAIGRWCYVW